MARLGLGAKERTAFVIIITGYLAITIAESILAPLSPALSKELGMEVGTLGFAFAVLTGSIAVGAAVGGSLMKRLALRTILMVSLLATGTGAVGAALSTGPTIFVATQALLGFSTGLFFAPGVSAIARAAGKGAKGLAMGIWGIAFSAGLTVAAVLAAIGAEKVWRLAFWIAGGTCLLAAILVWRGLRLGQEAPQPHTNKPRSWSELRRRLSIPLTVGAVGTVAQYGTVAFLALFAVREWGLTESHAALVVATGRILSVPGKLIVGRAADHWGGLTVLTIVTAVLIGCGAIWALVPSPVVAVGPAIVYAAAVSTLFPIANLLAVESFGDRGNLLGAYRSSQIAIGAASAWLMGLSASRLGLKTTLVVAALIPVVLLFLHRRRVPEVATS